MSISDDIKQAVSRAIDLGLFHINPRRIGRKISGKKKIKKNHTRYCICSKPAVRYSTGGYVCERCFKIEQAIIQNPKAFGLHHGSVTTEF